MEDRQPRRGIDDLKAALRAKLEGRQKISLPDRRKAVDAIASFGAPDTRFDGMEITVAGVPTVKFTPVQGVTHEGIIIHAHGGAFVAGSAQSHQYLAGALANQSGIPVYLPNYRLAPEHRYPTALDDITAVIRNVATEAGNPGKVALVGDSAGGALILSAVCRLRDEYGLKFAAMAMLSPFVDLRCENETYERLAPVDPFINQDGLKKDVANYLAGSSPMDPLASPLFANLRGLPPMLIQVGADEVLLGDALALKDAADRAGANARLHIWPDMIHVWHLFPHFVEEADAAIIEISEFLSSHIGK